MDTTKSTPDTGSSAISRETSWLNKLVVIALPLSIVVYFIKIEYLQSICYLATLVLSVCAIISIVFLWKESTPSHKAHNPVWTLLLYVVLLLMSGAIIYGFNANTRSDKEREHVVSRYFEKIRKDESSLAQFVFAMPKGGDLHHHYSGSVYAETYWEYLVKADCWINEKTLQVDSAHKQLTGDWSRCSKLLKEKKLADLKQRIIQQWSAKDYYDGLAPSNKLFFDAFDKFRIPAGYTMQEGLRELKKRAVQENVSYIETMLSGADSSGLVLPGEQQINAELIAMNQQGNSDSIARLLNELYDSYQKAGLFAASASYSKWLVGLHDGLQLDDSVFTIRYLTYTNRKISPIDCFRKLLLSFDVAAHDTLVSGVNIVSAEDNEISLRDFNLHIDMFRFCRALYPDVKVSMHAGELWPGLVKPEDLRFHIGSSVNLAKADRIGHGVDIAYEQNAEALLDTMARRKVAVEINLVSNEFILNVKEAAHPLLYYKSHKVPIVISTDDAGILRTDMTQQYFLLAKRYPSITYADMKEFVLNSLRYSFIKNHALREAMEADLLKRFALFEEGILKQSAKK